MNKDTLCDDLQKLNDEEVQSFFIQDAITRICQQQAEIDNLTSIKYVNGVTISNLYAEIEALKAEMSLNNYDDVKNVANQLFNEKISLRDYFAAKAMQGLIAGCYAGNNVGFTVEGNVFAAYEYADEMIKAQEK